MVVELFTGQHLRIVVVVRQVRVHSTESGSLLGAVTCFGVCSNEVSDLSYDLTILILEILLNVSSVLHVIISSIAGLSNVANRLESTAIVISGLSNRLRVTHFHFTSVDILFTYFIKHSIQVKYSNVSGRTRQTQFEDFIGTRSSSND
jgi:hypothetical protein